MIKRICSLLLMAALLLPAFCLGEAAFDDRNTVIAALGQESDFILVVENALYEKGYLAEIDVDGYFDIYTEAAVMAFQTYKGYVADGLLTKSQFYWLHRKYYNEWFDTSDIVLITASGSRYHRLECKSLVNSINVMPISVNIAYSLGYIPCKLCKPY